MVDNNMPDNGLPQLGPDPTAAANDLLNFIDQNQKTQPKNNKVSEALGGNYQKGATPPPTFSSQDQVNALTDYFKNPQSFAADRFAYSRPFTYGAGSRNMNFDRYYSHPGFDKLGFSPFVDNEAIYNEKTSAFADFRRAFPQMAYTAYLGAKSMVAPWTADDDAEAYSRAIAKGMSSRDGIAAWATNLGLNAGYTLGIAGEMALEEVALTAITAASGGAGAGLQAAETARGAANLLAGWERLNSIKKTFDAVRGANDARKVYELAKSGATAVAKFLNPLEHTAGFTYDAIKGLNGVDKLTNYAKIAKGVGSFFKDVQGIKTIYGEANLEAGMVQNEFNDKLINDFYRQYGRLPEQDEAQKIYESAQSAASSTMLANLPFIYLSNKIVLDNALKGFKPIRNAFREDAVDLAGKLVRDDATKTWSAVGRYSMTGIKQGLKPYNLLKGSLRYSTANLAEAVQENAQDAISASFKDYYDPKYGDPDLAASRSIGESFAKGIGEQFSAQGWSTFVSGFFTGAVVQGPQKLLFQGMPNAFHRITDPTAYANYKTSRQNYTDKVVTALNDVEARPGAYINAIQQNFSDQKRGASELSSTEKENDFKAHKDAQDESIFNHVYTLLQSGREQILLDQINGLKELNADELAEAFGRDGSTRDQPIENQLNSFEDKVLRLKDRYDAVNREFVNPFDPSRIDRNKDPQAFEEEHRNRDTFNYLKRQILFSQYAFDRSLERMTAISRDVSGASRPLAEASMTDFNLMFDLPSLRQEIDTLRQEIPVYEQAADARGRKEGRQKKQRLEVLKELQDQIAGYMGALKVRSGAQVKPETRQSAFDRLRMKSGTPVVTSRGEKLTVKKKRGDGRVVLSNNKVYNPRTLKLREEQETPEDFNIDDFVSGHLEGLKTAFDAYMQHLAKTNSDHLLNSKTEDAFIKLKDYYALSHDSFLMAGAINALTNPQQSRVIFERYRSMRDELDSQREVKLRAALDEFMRRMEGNDLLNALYKAGVYFDPAEIEPFLKNNTLPKRFIDVTTNQELVQGSPKWDEVMDILDRFNKITREVAPTVSQPQEEVAVQEKEETPQVSAPVEPPVAKKVTKILESVKTEEDLQEAEEELLGALSDFTKARELGIDSAKLADLLEAKRVELGSPSFDDIKVGNILTMKDPRYGRMVVVAKTPSEIVLKGLGEVPLTITRSAFSQEVQSIYAESQPVTPELKIMDVPMMSDVGLEAKTMQKLKKGYNEINPEEQFYADVKRKVLGSVFKGESNVPGMGAVRLTIMAADRIPEGKLRPETKHYLKMREARVDHSKAVSIVLTDQEGNILYLDDAGNKTSQDLGRPAYWNLRNPSVGEGGMAEFLEGDSQYESFDENRVRQVSQSMGVPVREARKIVEGQLNAYVKIREFINADKAQNEVALKITGGSYGRLLPEQRELKSLSEVNIPADQVFRLGDPTQGEREQNLYFELPHVEGTVRVENPFSPAELTAKMAILLSTPVNKLVDGQTVLMTDQEKLDISAQFYDKDVVTALEGKIGAPESEFSEMLSGERLAPNGDSLQRGTYTDFTLSTQSDGVLYTPAERPYTDFIKSNFEIARKTDAQGNPQTINAFFTFEPVSVEVAEEPLEAKLREVAGAELRPNEDETGFVDNRGNTYKRIADLDDTIERTEEVQLAAERGRVVNHLLRAFMNDELQDWKHFKSEARRLIKKRGYKVAFTDYFYKTLEDNFRQIRERLNNQGFTVIKNVPTVWGEIAGEQYAADVDILARDSEGVLHIIDLKTSTPNRRKDYEQDKWAYRQSDLLQMNALRELFRQRTGEDVHNISILPMLAVRDKKGVYSQSKLSKELDRYTIHVDTSKTIEELLRAKKGATVTSPMSNDDVREFMNKCNV